MAQHNKDEVFVSSVLVKLTYINKSVIASILFDGVACRDGVSWVCEMATSQALSVVRTCDTTSTPHCHLCVTRPTSNIERTVYC